MHIFLASDHAGFELKEKIKDFLSAGEYATTYTITDCGASSVDPTDDYPFFMSLAAQAVAKDPGAKAIIFGSSGQGEAMVANRFPGVRAVVYYGGSPEVAQKIITLSREHNDANILSIGARFVSTEDACATVALWLATPFSAAERHVRRIAEIDALHT